MEFIDAPGLSGGSEFFKRIGGSLSFLRLKETALTYATIKRRQKGLLKGFKESEWSNFYGKLFGREETDAEIKRIVDYVQERIQMAKTGELTRKGNPYGGIEYRKSDGTVVTMDQAAATNYGETKVFRDTQLWPDLPQMDLAEVVGLNVLVIEGRFMTPKKDQRVKEPYFAIRCATTQHGEFSTLTGGKVLHRQMAKLFSVDPQTGEALKDARGGLIAPVCSEETPVLLTFVQEQGKGQGEFMWNVIPALVQEQDGGDGES